MILENTYDSLNEGINDPGVFKAVFMAGGPGSGKSLAAKKLGFGSMGLRPVNSDQSFEMGLKKTIDWGFSLNFDIKLNLKSITLVRVSFELSPSPITLPKNTNLSSILKLLIICSLIELKIFFLSSKDRKILNSIDLENKVSITLLFLLFIRKK